jgi:hypothetical protein
LQQRQQAVLHHCAQFEKCKSGLRKLAMAPKLQEDEYFIFPGNRNKFTNTGKETQQ